MQRKRFCSNAIFHIIFAGITLIEVPYWWDGKYASLAATVYSYRPDLFTEKITGNPIPLTPPSERLNTKPESI
jgi:hypothetical protein